MSTTFDFYPDIPAGPNNPSFDQPNMLTNNQSINSIWKVDHLTFNDAGSGGVGASAGQHKFVTFNNVATPAPVINPLSIAFTQIGSASAVSELFFINSQATLLISAIKAFGVFTGGGSPVLTNSYNVASITGPSPYAITLKANVVTGNNVVVFTQSSAGNNANWTFANPVLTLISGASTGVLTFIVLQY